MPLVILPGVMADARAWMPVADAIDLDTPIFIVNRRGRTPSRSIGADYNVAIEVEDLVAVVKSIGGPVHLFGWSYGGLIALEAAAAGLPICSLAVYEPVSRPFAPETVQPIITALSQGNTDHAVEIINCDVSGFDRAYVDVLRRTPVWQELCRLSLPLGSELAAIDRFEPNYASYASINRPVTLILGEQNAGRGPYGTAFERCATAIPDAAIKRLSGEGHLAHISNPAILAQVVVRAILSIENSDGSQV
ncbi:alpha/beta fold hydrolase [Brucella intermedia]|uniref:alpha/beta fold hydrolase n=1 Tax=Brucella intermedia TaxID=94625 RepID=UPI002B055557|nr:alpha/beta hydrolase [Brucella intermedia]